MRETVLSEAVVLQGPSLPGDLDAATGRKPLLAASIVAEGRPEHVLAQLVFQAEAHQPGRALDAELFLDAFLVRAHSLD
jgi:hypothetical protein